MTELTGYPLDEAVALARAEGYEVDAKELCCRKGPAGTDRRVIRVTYPAEGRVELTWSAFTTELKTGREG